MHQNDMHTNSNSFLLLLVRHLLLLAMHLLLPAIIYQKERLWWVWLERRDSQGLLNDPPDEQSRAQPARPAWPGGAELRA